jgi:hypothetical protein
MPPKSTPKKTVCPESLHFPWTLLLALASPPHVPLSHTFLFRAGECVSQFVHLLEALFGRIMMRAVNTATNPVPSLVLLRMHQATMLCHLGVHASNEADLVGGITGGRTDREGSGRGCD